MAIDTTPETTVNSPLLGGTQDATQTVALATGGYVTAWNTDIGGQKDVVFQRYDALGNAVGGPVVANATVAGNQVLTDIAVTADGKFTLAWTSGTTVTTRSFDGATGAASSAEVNTTVTGTSASGAQLIAVSASQYKVVMSSDSGAAAVIEQATVDTAGVVVLAKATITAAAALGSSVTEMVDGNLAGSQFILLSGGFLLNSVNGGLRAIGATEDILKLQNGVHVLAGESGADVTMTGFSGVGNLFGTYSLGTAQATASLTDILETGQNVFDRALVNLGGNRILEVWVADTGTAGLNVNPDGVYAIVYNANTGQYEGGPTLISDLGFGGAGAVANLAAIRLEADLMADGRVSLSWSENSGLTGFDVFNSILDARDARDGPVTVNGTAVSGPIVGTAFDDSVVPSLNPSVHPYNDTLSYANSVAGVRVDLDNAILNRGDAAGDIAINFETVIGTAFADQLRGHDSNLAHAYINPITGEVIEYLPETGNDVLLGGGGNDQLVGRGGNDFLDGGTGDDGVSGGSGNDIIFGGDGIDVLYGNTGDDVMDGGIGVDFLAGGLGDDVIDGGDGNDTINGGADDDILDGGIGNDVIAGGTGFNVIDGGAGTDTLSFASIPSLSGQAGATNIYVDLDYTADAVGNMDGFQADDDLIFNIENITGSASADYIAGNAGVNVLRGGAGDDFLLSRGGNDRLFGGIGADSFIFENTVGGADLIRDFELGIDKIAIVSDNFSGINAGNIASRLTINSNGSVAGNSNAQFIFDNSGADAGRLLYDADGNGGGGAVLLATLTIVTPTDPITDLPVFSVDDFIFI